MTTSTQSVFDVKSFGAVGDGKTDDYPAFQQALDAIAALPRVPASSTGGDDPAGAMLFIPYGEYRLSQTLHITRHVIVQGVSGTGWFAGSRLKFPASTNGIVLHSRDTAATLGGGQAGWSAIRDLAILGGGPANLNRLPVPAVPEDDTSSGEKVGHGIVMRASSTISHCYVTGFQYDGIHIEGFAGRGVNVWRVSNCRVDLCGRHGLSVDGADANAGLAVSVDCSDNGGWGIYDGSFLGNTYLACHTDNNGHSIISAVAPSDPRVAAQISAEWAVPGWLTSLLDGGTVAFNSFWVSLAKDVAISDYTIRLWPVAKPNAITELVPKGKGHPAAGGARLAFIHPQRMPEGLYVVHMQATDAGGQTKESALAFNLEQHYGGAFKTTSAGNARSLFLGCYAEGTQNPSQLAWPTQFIGGIQANGFTRLPGDPQGAAFLRNGNMMSPMVVMTQDGQPNPKQIRTYLGYDRGASEPRNRHIVLGFQSSDDHSSLHTHPFYALMYEPYTPGWWELVYNTVLNGDPKKADKMPIAFSGPKSAEGEGQLRLDQGFYIGRGSARRLHRSYESPPSEQNPVLPFHSVYAELASTSRLWKRGDIVYNASPGKDTPVLGWVCVGDSSAVNKWGTWEPFGRLGAAVRSVGESSTVADGDGTILVDAKQPLVVTLPPAAGALKRQYTVKRVDAMGHSVTLAAAASETIDGVPGYPLGAQYAAVTVVSDGKGWLIIGKC